MKYLFGICSNIFKDMKGGMLHLALSLAFLGWNSAIIMKILDALISEKLVDSAHSISTEWFGRTISTLPGQFAVAAVSVGVVVTIVSLTKRLLTQDSSSRQGEAVTPRIPTAREAADLIEEFNKQDDAIATSRFSNYDSSKDRHFVFQLLETMVPVHINGTKIEYNGALFSSPVGKINYILMQAPLPSTMTHTQMMIQQNSVKQIVCLTTTGCDLYWENWNTTPVDGFNGLYIREPAQPSEWGNVKLWHYTEWPDNGVPNDLDEFIKFVKLQRNEYNDGAIVVHCSAGIGRTGVFMVATLMMDLVEKGERTLDPLDLIVRLRKVRPGSVQTASQLQFCFKLASRLLSAPQS
jgi:hypothetical protein